MLDKFVNSMVRQVGRDLGKVVSNQVFGNAHATPIRHVNRIANVPATQTYGSKTGDRRRKSDFEKSLNFKMSYTPPTLVNKLAGALIEFKNEAGSLIWDNYLSSGETQYFLSMLQDFNHKVLDVSTALELSPKTKPEDQDYLLRIIEDMKALVRKVVKSGYDGCTEEISEIDRKLSETNVNRLANTNLLWAGILVLSCVAGYFIWESWSILPVIAAGIGFYVSWNRLSDAKSWVNSLEQRRHNEVVTRNVLDGMIQSETFAATRR